MQQFESEFEEMMQRILYLQARWCHTRRRDKGSMTGEGQEVSGRQSLVAKVSPVVVAKEAAREPKKNFWLASAAYSACGTYVGALESRVPEQARCSP